MKEAFGRYAMGVIAQAVYGVDAKTFEEEESEFVKSSNAIQTKLSLKLLVVFFAYTLIPSFAKMINLR